MPPTKPWFKSYFSDCAMPSLTLCSLAAQGLWAQMYAVFHQEPIGIFAIGPRVIDKDDLFVLCRISAKDMRKVNLRSPSSKVNLKVAPEEIRALFDSLFEELLQAELFEVEVTGRIIAPWLVKREATRKKRAEGGKRGGNPRLMKDKRRPYPPRLTFEDKAQDKPQRLDIKKSPTDSAPHPQRARIGKILELFEKHGRPLNSRSIGAWSKRLSTYAESRDGDLDAACDALLVDLASIADAGKLRSSSYALKIVDGLIEHGRTGRGLEAPPRRRRPDVGCHPETLRAAEELD